MNLRIEREGRIRLISRCSQRWVRQVAAACIAAIGLTLGACATMVERNPVPEAYAEIAGVPALPPSVRGWGDALPRDHAARLDQYIAHRRQALKSGTVSRDQDFLAISGGGSNGAFGAGILIGWSEAGTRPQFALVTGVSTGALAAPFAFLGPAYDPHLREVYTRISDANIYEKRGVIEGLAGDSFADSHPLQEMVNRFVTADFMAAIAREHQNGRRLAVATTNLDAQRPVFWNMGEIASVGSPEALSLFREVLLASASVPGAFPPVHIDVAAGGQRYEEMHVDGGATREVFLLPEVFSFQEIDRRLGHRAKRRLFIIRNGKTTPEFKAVEARTLPILSRSISTVLKSQSDGDLYRLYTIAERDRIDYNLVAIPQDFAVTGESEFDPAYMNALFDVGYKLGRDGIAWQSAPPGLRN